MGRHRLHAGISGTDIPLGARILSVVDCFDALTSDRPYRPRLSTEDAFAIILEERGSLYDPLIVDTFIKAYPRISPAALRAGEEATTLIDVSKLTDSASASSPTSLDQIKSNASETAVLDGYRRRMTAARSTAEALTTAGQCPRQLTGATVYAFYRYDEDLDLLTCEHAVGDKQGLLDGLSIGLGTKVTGWTAATGRVSVNADASLDLAHIAACFSPPLRCTLSVPVTHGDRLIGVLTAYANREAAFQESDRYVFEQVVSEFQNRVPQVSRNTSGVVAFSLHKR